MKNHHRALLAGALSLALCAPALAAGAPSGKPDTAKAKPQMPSQACHYHHWTVRQLDQLTSALAAEGIQGASKGCWNGATRAAVTAFQKKHGLKTTGFPNAKTRKALGLDW